MHQCHVFNDKCHQPKILKNLENDPIYGFNYSENLMQTYSYQLQSCYSNKKPFLLHCTVKHMSDDSHYHIYQICDHMSHDFASISINNCNTFIRIRGYWKFSHQSKQHQITAMVSTSRNLILPRLSFLDFPGSQDQGVGATRHMPLQIVVTFNYHI